MKISLWRCSTFTNAVVGFHLASDLWNYQRLTGIELLKVNLDNSMLTSQREAELTDLTEKDQAKTAGGLLGATEWRALSCI